MKYKVTKNFDWSITNRKACIFIPNFGKKEHLLYALSQMRTRVPRDDWVIIIGNDGIDIDFNFLKSKNVYYYTIHRDPASSRNGAFNRNYAIKRCQSEYLIQKDPEVVLLGDFVRASIEAKEGWRAGNIYVLTRALTAELVAEDNLDVLKFSACIPIAPVKILDPKHAKYIIVGEDGRVNFSSYFHYAYSVPTRVLQNMQGYDERYLHYGYEDSDIFCRLLKLKYYLIPDNSVTAVHLFHDRDPGFDLKDLKKMRQIFIEQDPMNTSRNDTWGEGGP
jgi:hypothetical protein